jgi:hypothetical protein
VRPNGRVGQFRLIAAPDQHAPGLVTFAVSVEWEREAAVQELDCNCQLFLVPVADQRLVDQLTPDPPPLEITGNPLVAPTIEQPPVLRKPPRIASVVDKTFSNDSRNDIVDDRRRNLSPP